MSMKVTAPWTGCPCCRSAVENVVAHEGVRACISLVASYRREDRQSVMVQFAHVPAHRMPCFMARRDAVIALRQMRSIVLVAALSVTASAKPMTITGDVMDARSRWTADGSRIVTEATVHTTTGDVVVSQLGGSVDGIAMRTFPGPEPLVPGMRVTLAAREDYDLSQRAHVV